MKSKLDENLPEALVVQLAELGHEVDNVRLEKINDNPTRSSGRRRKKPDVF